MTSPSDNRNGAPTAVCTSCRTAAGGGISTGGTAKQTKWLASPSCPWRRNSRGRSGYSEQTATDSSRRIGPYAPSTAVASGNCWTSIWRAGAGPRWKSAAIRQWTGQTCELTQTRYSLRQVGPTEPNALLRLDLESGQLCVLRCSSTTPVDPGYLSIPETIEFPTEGGLTAHAFFYRPQNRDFTRRSRVPNLRYC